MAVPKKPMQAYILKVAADISRQMSTSFGLRNGGLGMKPAIDWVISEMPVEEQPAMVGFGRKACCGRKDRRGRRLVKTEDAVARTC